MEDNDRKEQAGTSAANTASSTAASSNLQAETEKALGNEAFQAGRFQEAIDHFSLAIKHDPNNHILFSNRSAAYASLQMYDKALEDANKTIQLKPNWIKGYSRKGTALHLLGRLNDAADAYAEGLEHEPENDVLRQSLAAIIKQVDTKWREENTGLLSEEGTNREVSGPPRIETGAWVPMITPFTLQNNIDWLSVDRLVEFYIAKGVSGIFVLSVSGEMYNLSNEERILLTRRVVVAARGRVTVVACGNFGATVEEQVGMIKKIYNTGVDAVVCAASLIAKQIDGEEIWRNNFQSILDKTGGNANSIPLGVYECPQPYHRLLTPGTTKWLAGTGRVFFVKDTCSHSMDIHAKMEAAKSNLSLKLFNGNVTTLQKSLEMNAAGFCGIAANCYPDLFAWLCKNYTQQEGSTLQRFLSVAELTVAHKYPQSAKVYLKIFEKGFQGLEVVCRSCTHQFNEEEALRLSHLHDLVCFAREQLKAAKSHAKPVML
jgi:4-hydroxy-tetrahydrodipicolinate synthase